MTDLGELRGIGPKTRLWLAEIDLHTLDDLLALGSVETYRRLKAARPREVSLNALYGLEAALIGCRWDELPPDVKADLRAQVLDEIR